MGYIKDSGITTHTVTHYTTHADCFVLRHAADFILCIQRETFYPIFVHTEGIDNMKIPITQITTVQLSELSHVQLATNLLSMYGDETTLIAISAEKLRTCRQLDS